MHTLTHSTHGKSRVRVSKILRPREKPAVEETHRFLEAAVEVLLEGGTDAAYTDGDNANVVATDTVKNTVFALARDTDYDDLPTFGRVLANHFLSRYEHVTKVTVAMEGHTWHRLLDCPHAFTGSDAEARRVTVVAERGQPLRLADGFGGLMLAKTTATSFENFHRDAYRTLPDAADRVLATVLTASWAVNGSADRDDFDAVFATVRGALLTAFVDHHSVSVQATLYRMASAALDATDAIDAVTMSMPNKHHLPVDLSKLDRENDNVVFQVTDEPAGAIQATVTRGR
ncbi:factor-independent urate hydroxylase [Phycisphaera mikurensis]|uniref:Uricase n=1 Tax=Phycisphaera mikurensis (strain NBRC 102666 / KCTC 22515 / FYK2301M01) TaxID=1142394 RepID=I0IIY0_PHYMF|nr:urate oxidase [Phycisphaera mikurensis]MBB6443397.1 urate oxidase [Phycisphaera mikurensis]BAM05218.1 uricase [Phycisphaera mikurensis NBRC 102666]